MVIQSNPTRDYLSHLARQLDEAGHGVRGHRQGGGQRTGRPAAAAARPKVVGPGCGRGGREGQRIARRAAQREGLGFVGVLDRVSGGFGQA